MVGNLLERGTRILFRVLELYLLDGDNINVNSNKNSSVSILTMGDFFVCKLHLNITGKNKNKAKTIYEILGVILTCFHFRIFSLNFCLHSYIFYIALITQYIYKFIF